MFQVISQMASLIICGLVWARVQPAGLSPTQSRLVLTSLVYYLLLPALVLVVLWQAPLGTESLIIAGVAACGVLTAMLLSGLIYRRLATPASMTGALILAAAFPNATYLGLPVLEATFGTWARSIAIQYDLFACTPLLLTAGIVTARRFGLGEQEGGPTVAMLARVPALWAALAAIILNISSTPAPQVVIEWLNRLASPVVTLMLIALGMGLSWRQRPLREYFLLLPVLVIQLVFMPLLVYLLGLWLGLGGETLTAVTLEGAMPCMVLGIVLCDRFRLDSNLYALAVTLSTLASLVTLPLWFELVHA